VTLFGESLYKKLQDRLIGIKPCLRGATIRDAGRRPQRFPRQSPTVCMNLHFNHNPLCTSIYFVGRDRLRSGASARSEPKRKWTEAKASWSDRGITPEVVDAPEVPIAEAMKQWTHVSLSFTGTQIVVNVKGL
jgi:hypothetical protein